MVETCFDLYRTCWERGRPKLTCIVVVAKDIVALEVDGLDLAINRT